MKRRGQAALEFLTTYGWAFLVILVVIGALAYFGVLNPQNFIPERCTFQQELTCQDYVAERVDDSSTRIQFYLQNNLGNSIVINGADWSAFSSTVDTSSSSCTTGGNVTISSGAATEVNCTFTTTFPAEGVKARFNIDGEYTELAGRYPHSVKGEIFVTLR